MQSNYSRAQLNKIATDNYNTLRRYCSIIDTEGYWDGPGKVLKQSVFDILDLYVQCVLVRLADYCGKLGPEEREFIGSLTRVNSLEISGLNEITEKTLESAERFLATPPILFQLFGLRDQEKGSTIIGLFFDALLNIQLALAFLNYVGMDKVTGFIRDYYYKIEVFLYAQGKYTNIINEKYIFLKLCNGVLEKSNEYLVKAGEDFDYYKRHFLFMGTLEYSSSPIPSEAEAASFEEEQKNTASKDNHEEATQIPEEAEQKQPPAEPAQAIEEAEENTQASNEAIKASKLDELLFELNGLVGLDEVKAEIKSLINLIKVRTMRKLHGLPDVDMSYHMVFTGSPGTGKTTVARLVAAIYRELGLLSKGTLVETDRSGLVAGYVGQTALKVREVVEKAVGGVLFIDEAYALSTAIGTNDFGEEAIETLVKLMEDHRDDLVVIVAGYTAEMQRFLKANTGLQSRFNKFIEFSDYSNVELLAILKCMATKAGFVIEDEVEKKIGQLLSQMSELRRTEFGNARGIRNMFERMVVNQANRVVGLCNPTVDDLTHIISEDVIE